MCPLSTDKILPQSAGGGKRERSSGPAWRSGRRSRTASSPARERAGGGGEGVVRVNCIIVNISTHRHRLKTVLELVTSLQKEYPDVRFNIRVSVGL